MPFVLIIIGVILLVVAVRDTYGSLGQALSTDIPGYATWALALAGVGALGFVPGLKTPARWLLLLVLVVLVLKNYQAILTGFAGSTSTADATTPPQTPAAAYASNPTSPIPAADVSGTGTTATTGTQLASQLGSGGNINADMVSTAASATSTAMAAAPFDPTGVVDGFLQQAGVSAIFSAAEMGFGAVG